MAASRRDHALIREAWKALEEVQDIEVPVSVVDLGLIRDVRIEGERLTVDLTFASMGSPCIEWTREDVRRRLEALDGLDGQAVDVNLVWSPPWTAADLTPRGREAFCAIGVIP
jgi:metal-sulfur cluster biosynthetic enzyme